MAKLNTTVDNIQRVSNMLTSTDAKVEANWELDSKYPSARAVTEKLRDFGIVDDNQTVKVGTTTFGANDEIELVAGDNVSISGDTANRKITISSVDTDTHNSHAVISGTNTAGTEIIGEASVGDIILGNSGVTAGEYGPTEDAAPGYGETFNVPDIKVNNKGIVTSVINRTVKIPVSDNTDPALTITDKNNSDTDDLVYAVTNLAEGGTNGHAITPTYTGLPTKTYVDKVATGHVKYLGTVSALSGLSTSAGQGDFYRVSTAFTFGSETAHLGDIILATKDSPAQNATDWDLIHAEVDTNSWTANTKSNAGYVAKGENNANKVWKTDSDGNPGWRDDADTNTHNSHKIKSGTKADGTTEIVSASASSGDITLGDSGVAAGTYGPTNNQTPGYGATFDVPQIKVNAKGIVTSITNTTVQIPYSDDTDTGATSVEVTGTGNAVTTATYDEDTRKLTLTKGATYNNYSHPNSGVTAGTYTKVTVNAQGHITNGSNPTTLSDYGITDAYTKTEVNTLTNNLKPAIGNILITSTKENPSTTVGGSWELIDKEYKPIVSANVYWTPSMSGPTPYAECSGYITRINHSINLYAQLTTKIALSGANSYSLGSFDHDMIGGAPNLPLAFGYTGSTFATAIYTSGSTPTSCLVRCSIGWDGSFTIDEIINTTKQLPIGTVIYLNTPIPMDPEYMGDSFCNKFYWKRIADQAAASAPLPASEGLTYTLRTDGAYEAYEVSGIGDCQDTDVVIPKFYDNRPVAYIGNSAFMICASLTSITIPDSVTTIGNYAFEFCTGLASITIPDSVTSIGNRCFYGCSNLKSVVIPDGVTSIGEQAFAYCNSLTSITIPDSVTSISDSAFYNCTGLKSVELGDSVTSIGKSAFYRCDSLPSIVIPDSVTSIDSYAFYYCTYLSKVYITDLEAWYKISFSNWESNPMHNGAALYLNEKLVTEIEIPDTISAIKNYAFYGCKSLTSVIIPDSVTTIGSYAFCGCAGLTEIVIPASVTSIGDGAFSGCGSLTEIVIPDSVTSIGKSAFSRCTGLTEIVIPDSVTSIGDYAFTGCANLQHIYCCFASGTVSGAPWGSTSDKITYNYVK